MTTTQPLLQPGDRVLVEFVAVERSDYPIALRLDGVGGPLHFDPAEVRWHPMPGPTSPDPDAAAPVAWKMADVAAGLTAVADALNAPLTGPAATQARQDAEDVPQWERDLIASQGTTEGRRAQQDTTVDPAIEQVENLAKELRRHTATHPMAPVAIRAAAGWLMDLARQRDDLRERAEHYQRERDEARLAHDNAKWLIDGQHQEIEYLRDRVAKPGCAQAHEDLATVEAQRDEAAGKLDALRAGVAKLADEITAKLDPFPVGFMSTRSVNVHGGEIVGRLRRLLDAATTDGTTTEATNA